MTERHPEVPLPYDERNRNGERICVMCGAKLPKYCRRWCDGPCGREYSRQKGYFWRDDVFEANRKAHGGLLQCVKCGKRSHTPLGTNEPFDADHIIPIALGGDPVDISNGQVLCTPCHKEKTAGDMAKIAKAKRASRPPSPEPPLPEVGKKNHTIFDYTEGAP